MSTQISELVKILTRDSILVRNWSRLYDILNAPTPEKVLWENGLQNSTLFPNQLFTKLLENWKRQRGNEATVSKLSECLTRISYQSVSDSLLEYQREKLLDDVISVNMAYGQEAEKPNHLNPGSSINQLSFGVTETVCNFVGRKMETEKLLSYFNGNGKRLVLLSGLGGVGKTELVRNFINKQLIVGEIICSWFSGDSTESFNTSIIQYAAQFGIRLGETDNSQTILNKIASIVYEQYGQRRWLVVVDNVDEAHDEISNAIQFLRKQKKIFVIVTSRLCQLFSDEADLIQIEELLSEDAQQLVVNSVKVSDPENIPLLCQKLQNYPLALQQAITFITQQQRKSVEGNSYGISDYLKDIEKKSQTFLNFPSKLISDKYEKTTLLTLNVTMDSIRNTHGENGIEASKLLNIIAFVQPDSISLPFLSNLYSIYYSSSPLHEINFNELVTLLKNYSIVKVENSILSVHRLVQKVTQIQVNDFQGLLTKLLNGIDIENPQNVEICQVIRLWQHAADSDELIKQLSDFPYQLFFTLKDLCFYPLLLKFSKINHERLKSVLGEEHLDTLWMEHNVAEATSLKGNSEEALQLYQTVFEKQKRVFGEQHTITLNTGHNIGVVLYDLDRYHEALECLSKVLQLKQQTAGVEIKSIVKTKLNIALVLDEQGKYSEAMEKYEEVLNWRKNELGGNHPSTLSTRYNIACCLYNQQKYKEAKVELESVLKLRMEILGEDHSETLSTKYMLALSLNELGEWESAVEILKQVLVVQEKVLGVDHPDTISTRNVIEEIN